MRNILDDKNRMMFPQNMSPKEFLEIGGKWNAIKKEVPPGSNRWMLLGFERPKRSRKSQIKYFLEKPIWMDDLAKNSIKNEPDTPIPSTSE